MRTAPPRSCSASTAQSGPPRRDALSRSRQRRAGARAGVARDHAEVRDGGAAQSACAPHADAHLHAARRLGRGDPGQPAGGGGGIGASRGAHGEFVWDEFPHAIEYLVYAYLQKGADERAAAQLQRLRDTPRLEPTFKTAFHLASTTARDVLERRAWDEAVSVAPRQPASLEWDRFAWPEAIAWFARGLGAAHLGRLADATAASARLEALEAATRKSGEELFARNIQLLRLELSAWLAHVEGRQGASVALMREAADLETSTPKHAVTPGPTIPAHELLGDLLMEQEQPGEALARTSAPWSSTRSASTDCSAPPARPGSRAMQPRLAPFIWRYSRWRRAARGSPR